MNQGNEQKKRKRDEREGRRRNYRRKNMFTFNIYGTNGIFSPVEKLKKKILFS